MGTIFTHPHDEKLRIVCEPVQNFDDELAHDCNYLLETLKSHDGGLGLAANQVGFIQRFFIVKLEGFGFVEMINPKITNMEGEQFEVEGCLSVPHYYSKIKRAYGVDVEYRDIEGVEKRIHLEGIEAVEVQHELDHLNGILFIDHLPLVKLKMFKSKYSKILQGIKRGKLKGVNDGSTTN